MGDMSMTALNRAEIEEGLADEYAQGQMSMEDAFEHGFLDATGAEVNMDAAWERSFIPTREAVENALSHATKDLDLYMYQGEVVEVERRSGLNKAAIKNLSKERPTCNCCQEEMTPRIGKFGKFYYCMNQCEDQKCVSDKYWQSVRR